jgi:hypothetical protein
MIPGAPQLFPANGPKVETAGIEPAQCSRRGPKRRSLAERFWPKVAQPDAKDCWEWLGHRDHRGYGRLKSPGKTGPVFKAHRVSYEMHHGPVPEGLHVLHRCDNPACVNPAHLYVGTHADNMDDIARRRRSGRMKFSDEDVRALRVAVDEGMSIAAAARRFGVSESQAHNLVKGHQRRYAGGPIREAA